MGVWAQAVLYIQRSRGEKGMSRCFELMQFRYLSNDACTGSVVSSLAYAMMVAKKLILWHLPGPLVRGTCRRDLCRPLYPLSVRWSDPSLVVGMVPQLAWYESLCALYRNYQGIAVYFTLLTRLPPILSAPRTGHSWLRHQCTRNRLRGPRYGI